MEKSRTFKLNFNSMRNKILLLLTALLGMNNQMWAGNVEIPDATFKSLLVAKYDTDKDREISTTEAEAVNGTIDVSFKYKITSVKGIEAFKNIDGFKCQSNNISGVLDLRSNPKITVLKCSNNAGITKILLAKNSSSLTTIESYEIASLTDLDLSCAPNLYTLDCHGCTHLTSLDVTKNTKLTNILCYNCSIDMINLLYNTLTYTNAKPKLYVGNQKDINGSDKRLTILGSSSKYYYYKDSLATNVNNGNVEFKSITGTAVRYKKAGESNWSYENVTRGTTININDGQFDNYEVMGYDPKATRSYTLNYTRTFKTGIWAARMLPFKVVLRKERMEGLTFAKIVSSSKSGGTLKVVVEPLALKDTLEANTPYVVLNTTSTDIERTFSVTLQPLVINTNLSPTVVGDCTFESNYGIITSQDGDDWYALAADESGFTHITQSGLSLKPFRFLLRVNGGSSQAKIAIAESNATGIQSLKNARESDAYYDLMGRRVQHPTKGIYIHQGKKIIIK